MFFGWTFAASALAPRSRGDNFTPTPTVHPQSGVNQFLLVGSGAQRNQLCQISARSVQGFLSTRWPKIAISHWLEVSPLQQCRPTHWRATLWCTIILCMLCKQIIGPFWPWSITCIPRSRTQTWHSTYDYVVAPSTTISIWSFPLQPCQPSLCLRSFYRQTPAKRSDLVSVSRQLNKQLT